MEAPQNAQAVLTPAAIDLQLIRLRPARLMLRWLVPLVAIITGGGLAQVLARYQSDQAAKVVLVLTVAVVAIWQVVVWLHYPEAGIEVIGTAHVSTQELSIQLLNEPVRSYWLSQAGPPLIIRYTGYADEAIGREKLSGYENFIGLDDKHLLRFWVPDYSVTVGLQDVLRAWYEQHIPVKEYCQDSRTFLLARDLSYEQIQAYKQEFGVGLYQ